MDNITELYGLMSFYININGNVETENDSLINIDENIRQQLMINKQKFFRDGFATYQDVEYLCNKVVKSVKLCRIIAGRFPVVIVDECQDLSPSPIIFIRSLKERRNNFAFCWRYESSNI